MSGCLPEALTQRVPLSLIDVFPPPACTRSKFLPMRADNSTNCAIES
jgi:hypothetical protein